jgi:hypothetical protein
VDVQMKNRLPCLRVRIYNSAITGTIDSLFFRHSPGHGQQMAQKRFVTLQVFVQRSDVFAGNDKQMNRSFGIGVLKDKAVFVLVQYYARPFTGGYLAEYAAEHTHHPFPVNMKSQHRPLSGSA